MTPAHYIEPFAKIVDVRMCTSYIRQANIRHVTPRVIEKFSPALRLVTHREIVRQDRRAVIYSLLMRRVHVTERGTFIKNVIPCEWKITCETRCWTILQKQIRDERCVV